MNGDVSEQKREAVIHVAHSILEKKSFNETARAIFNYCKTLTAAQSGYVALLSEDGKENDIVFLEPGGLSCTVDPELPMPLRGLRKVACSTQKTVFENDFMNSDWVRLMPPGHVTLRNVMFAPLNTGDQTVGILGLANKPTDFTNEDAEMAAVFGELAALALQNSRLIERLNAITNNLFIPIEQ